MKKLDIYKEAKEIEKKLKKLMKKQAKDIRIEEISDLTLLGTPR